MKRSEFKREAAYSTQVLDSAVELIKVRFPSLIRESVDREFSMDQPDFVSLADAQLCSLHSRALQEAARGLLSAARERASVLVARAVAERVAGGGGEIWRVATKEREARAQRDFDEYRRAYREREDRNARLKRIRNGSIAAPTRLASERAALRARINALRLPRIQ